MYLHLDMDYFYAQVEEKRRPMAKDKIIVVCVYSGRTEDSGVVSTVNYLGREIGIKSAMPIALAKKKAPPADDYSYEPAFADESAPQQPSWKRHQSVMHKKFGRGVIEKVEQRSTGAHLTIRFKNGIKKLDSSFIMAL